ncbi:heptaprenyl diphosphate synthase component 1 [Cerasibacillus sp.]|uniref:heptaprenyl diphosphate synthase component 1 n=1 Tax=Cerasibacillus sp. TaxID=2498711 RepID=UPI002F3E7492
MHNIMLDLEKIQTLIKEQAHYQYLDKHIQAPNIDQGKLLLLYTLLKNRDIPEQQKENYVMTTMLVQMALDTHDLVNNKEKNQDSEGVSLEQQLLVLAGDYYSSLYYLLLSNIDEYELIQTLAIAIRKINEAKIKVYYREFDTFEELLELIKTIEASLYTHLALYIDEPAIVSYIEEWLLIYTLNNGHEHKKSIINQLQLDLDYELFLSFIENDMEEHMMTLRKQASQLRHHHDLFINQSQSFLDQIINS